ncbi:PRC-barrel domain-containing protein [Ramlibacter rhizophilus]|uniref:PRC-barrel domain containing protein n=1 Tax=Ramlibacter rhizophilus TaxID=1781167 RepID=A0A4Z0C209_9BURK|nr:PRC-barrel domain-containing protein [Ramlibacter rhizophilus]TFZ04275.1 hypothetical protein EZ242_00500 [Ramlibacter rhizophilus]
MLKSSKARLHIISGAVLALALAGGAAAQAQSSGATGSSGSQAMQAQQGSGAQSGVQNYRGMRVNDMIGMPVVSPDNRRMGTLSDLVIDISTGDVRYALLSFERGLFQEDALAAVPTKQLFQTVRDGALVLQGMNREQLMASAVRRTDYEGGLFDRREARLFDNRPLWTGIDRTWGMGTPTATPGAMLATRIIDREVNTATEDDIGEIEALVVNLANSKVHYAVLEFDPGWLSPERKIAVPITAFQRGRGMESDELSTNLTKQRVGNMPALDRNWYGRLNDPAYVAGVDRTFLGVGTGTALVDTGVMGSGPNTNLFNRLDEDGNGWLDRRELDAVPDLGRHWGTVDADRDGRLSRQEFTRFGVREERRTER